MESKLELRPSTILKRLEKVVANFGHCQYIVLFYLFDAVDVDINYIQIYWMAFSENNSLAKTFSSSLIIIKN